MTLNQTLSNSIGNDFGQQSNRANSVVVTRDGVLEIVGISVRVENPDDRNTKLLGFVDGEVLAQWVNHPHSTRGFLKVSDTTERLLKFGELALFEQQLFLGEALCGVFVVDFFEFFHATKTLRHGLEVGQETTEPPLVHIRLSHAGCLLADSFLSLLLGAHKQNGSTVGNGLTHKVVGLVDKGQGLLQVDDVNATAFGQNKALDFGVPPTSLVSKVNTAVEQLSNCYGSHRCTPLFSVISPHRRCEPGVEATTALTTAFNSSKSRGCRKTDGCDA